MQQRLFRVETDKTRIEHNKSAFGLIATNTGQSRRV
jgi:hypothetical protein